MAFTAWAMVAVLAPLRARGRRRRFALATLAGVLMAAAYLIQQRALADLGPWRSSWSCGDVEPWCRRRPWCWLGGRRRPRHGQTGSGQRSILRMTWHQSAGSLPGMFLAPAAVRRRDLMGTSVRLETSSLPTSRLPMPDCRRTTG